jgi:hypothetical protein
MIPALRTFVLEYKIDEEYIIDYEKIEKEIDK